MLRLTLSISCCKQAYSAGDEKTKGLIRTLMLLRVRRMGSEKRLPLLPLEMWDMIVSFVDVNYAIKSRVISPEKILSITQQKEKKNEASGSENSTVTMSRN